MIDFEKKRQNLKKIIEKHKIEFFWEAYLFFVEKAGYAEESAFAECIFYFGEEAMFNNIIFIRVSTTSKLDGIRLIMYYDVNYHENLKNLIEYCIKNNWDIQSFGIDTKEIVVNINSQAVFDYVQIMYEKIKNVKLPGIHSLGLIINKFDSNLKLDYEPNYKPNYEPNYEPNHRAIKLDPLEWNYD